MWRLIYFIPIWLAFMAFKLVVVIIGLPITAGLYFLRDQDKGELIGTWMTPWINPEDWTGGPQAYLDHSLPEWWIERHDGKVTFGMWWHYHAIRNPANGLRNFEWLDLDPIPEMIRYRTPMYLTYYEPWHVRKGVDVPTIRIGGTIKHYPKNYGYLCWQGFRAGAKFVHHWNDERHFVLKIGWRIEPRDAHEPMDPDGIRHEDAGFASKLLVYREG